MGSRLPMAKGSSHTPWGGPSRNPLEAARIARETRTESSLFDENVRGAPGCSGSAHSRSEPLLLLCDEQAVAEVELLQAEQVSVAPPPGAGLKVVSQPSDHARGLALAEAREH